MRRAAPALLLLVLAIPASAQEGSPHAPPESARDGLHPIEPDPFVDDGTYREETWDAEAWGEEWAAADSEWEASHGDVHEEAHFDLQELFAQSVNFVLWLAIVIFLARKPLTTFLQNRRLAVEEGLVEAKSLKEAAEAKYDDYSERLERLDEELAKLRAEMVQAGQSERDRIIAEAEARAARMRADARFVIDQQLKQLRTDLTREAIEAAIGAAERVLTEQVQETDQSRLAQDYLEGLDTSMKQEDGVRA